MNLSNAHSILSENDGSLPDITLEFEAASVVATAYSLVQSRARSTDVPLGHYWSKSKNEDCTIQFGENPALQFLDGEADPFHVCFSGITSSSGTVLPPIGLGVLDRSTVPLDLRMGVEWSEDAILGLFELVHDLCSLSLPVSITHTGNDFDPNGETFLAAYQSWLSETWATDAASHWLPATQFRGSVWALTIRSSGPLRRATVT